MNGKSTEDIVRLELCAQGTEAFILFRVLTNIEFANRKHQALGYIVVPQLRDELRASLRILQ